MKSTFVSPEEPYSCGCDDKDQINQKDAIEALEAEWDESAGFFLKLRGGSFCESGAGRVIHTIESLCLRTETTINTRLVQLLWYIPTFIRWQIERMPVDCDGRTNLVSFETKLMNEMESAIGVP